MINTLYIVHSDVDENNIRMEFNTKDEAIEYAKGNDNGFADKTWVEAVEVEYDDHGNFINEGAKETVWSYNDDFEDELVKEHEEELDGEADAIDTKVRNEMIDAGCFESVEDEYPNTVKEDLAALLFDPAFDVEFDAPCCEVDTYADCNAENCKDELVDHIEGVIKALGVEQEIVDDFTKCEWPEPDDYYKCEPVCKNCDKIEEPVSEPGEEPATTDLVVTAEVPNEVANEIPADGEVKVEVPVEPTEEPLEPRTEVPDTVAEVNDVEPEESEISEISDLEVEPEDTEGETEVPDEVKDLVDEIEKTPADENPKDMIDGKLVDAKDPTESEVEIEDDDKDDDKDDEKKDESLKEDVLVDVQLKDEPDVDPEAVKDNVEELLADTKELPDESESTVIVRDVEELEDPTEKEDEEEGLEEDVKSDIVEPLVKDEEEAIKGYEDAQKDLEKEDNISVENKEKINQTFDHIKDEEKEHIDEIKEVTGSVTESAEVSESKDVPVVPCEVNDIITHCEDEKPVDCKSEKKPLEKLLTENEQISEETHNQYAMPEGDKIKSYNNALKYAQKENCPFIYGYTNGRLGGKFFALGQPIKCKGEDTVQKVTDEFNSRYKNSVVVYVAYPDKDPVEELLTEEASEPATGKVSEQDIVNDINEFINEPIDTPDITDEEFVEAFGKAMVERHNSK